MAAQELTESLQARGVRATRQRRAVLQVLQESDEHLDAEAVHDRVKARDPRISLATVYRTLAMFKEAGLVEEHSLGESHAHFEATPQTPHYHFTCLRCGRVIEFDAPEVARVVRRLVTQEGVQVAETHLSLTGHCADCQSATSDDSTARGRGGQKRNPSTRGGSNREQKA